LARLHPPANQPPTSISGFPQPASLTYLHMEIGEGGGLVRWGGEKDEEGTIKGVKVQDFVNFCKVVEIVRNKGHLTESGLEQILLIKAGGASHQRVG